MPASAADLFYSGHQQFNSNGILATYTFETDGKTGPITASDIVHFSVTLSDSFGSYSFDDTTGTAVGNAYANTDSFYEPTSRASTLTLSSNQTFNGFASGQLVFNHFANQAQIEDANGGRYFVASGTAVIATAYTPAMPATPAVPEPTVWALVLAGFGAVGSALRRRSGRRVGAALA